MTRHTPTDEQIAIVAAAVDTKENLIIEALAGAAKSSTLELIARALPPAPTLMLAFNKKTADELSERMPANCKCMTLNSLGHRAWGEMVGGRLVLSKDKCAEILREQIKELPTIDQDVLWENFGELLRAVSHAKGAGHVPDQFADVRPCTPLMNDKELIDSLDEILSPLEAQLLLRTLELSMSMAFEGKIDFNDQLLMPTVFRASFPSYPLVMIDEAQDLSELNHAMIAKLAKRRIIAVGDQCQAIYAFRGAHESGMDRMADRFNMTRLTLSTTFRCPQEIVEHVRWRAPHMKAWDQHPLQGSVTAMPQWSLDDIPDDCAVICRNNAPLFSVAIALLKDGRYPNLWGNDIGAGLLKVMDKFGNHEMGQEQALLLLAAWHEEQAKRVKNQKALEDKRQCIEIFLLAADTLKGAINYAQTLFRSRGRVNLLTGHKSKGAEWDHVFFLNEEIVGDEGQDPNLRYVIATRAKASLTYIKSGERVK
jgi:F-box protein 18 (helicase)